MAIKNIFLAAITGVVLSSTLNVAAGVAQDKPRIAVLYLDSEGFYAGIKKGMDEGAKQGVSLIESNSQFDAAKEAEFVDSAIAADVKAIIMSPVSTEASVVTVEKIAAAGIPVICYNSCLNEADTARLAKVFVTTDQYDFGHQLGVAAGQYIKEKGIVPVFGMLTGDKIEIGQQRKKGFLDGVTSVVGDVKVAASEEALAPDVATQRTTEMLTAHPEINVMYAVNEGSTLGAVLGIEAAKMDGSTVVFGSDATTQIMGMLKDGSVLKMTVVQNPQLMGKTTMEAALKVIAGQAPDAAKINVPIQLFEAKDPASIDGWLSAHSDGIP